MSQMLHGFGKRTAESPCLLIPPVKFSKPMTTSRATSKRGIQPEAVAVAFKAFGGFAAFRALPP